MKIKIKKVYYCDFCKKRSFHKSRMIKHELYCTLNPNRECKLCGIKSIKLIIEKCKNYLQKNENNYIIIKKGIVINNPVMVMEKLLEIIRKDTENCPNCILTIIRCCNLDYYSEFDYKKEIKIWFDRVNKEEQELIGLEG